MSFTIKLLSNTVDYEKIIEYYNKNKKPEMRSLERLDRIEGGFQIFKDILRLTRYILNHKYQKTFTNGTRNSKENP